MLQCKQHIRKSNLASANASTLEILHRNGVYSIKVRIRKINLNPKCFHAFMSKRGNELIAILI